MPNLVSLLYYLRMRGDLSQGDFREFSPRAENRSEMA